MRIGTINSSNGALLVEALISFALLFTVGLVVMGLQAQAYRAADKSRALSSATILARETLEQTLSLPFGEVALGESSTTETIEFLRAGEVASTQFLVRQVVEDGPVNGIRSVWIEVTWESGRIDLEGYVSDSI